MELIVDPCHCSSDEKPPSLHAMRKHFTAVLDNCLCPACSDSALFLFFASMQRPVFIPAWACGPGGYLRWSSVCLVTSFQLATFPNAEQRFKVKKNDFLCFLFCFFVCHWSGLRSCKARGRHLSKPFHGQGLVVFSSPEGQELNADWSFPRCCYQQRPGFRELLNASNIPATSQVP